MKLKFIIVIALLVVMYALMSNEGKGYKYNHQFVLFNAKDIDSYSNLEKRLKQFASSLGFQANYLMFNEGNEGQEAKKIVFAETAMDFKSSFEEYIVYYRFDSGDVHIRIYASSKESLRIIIKEFSSFMLNYKFTFLDNL